MIGFLAKQFRRIHMMVGITAPRPGSNEKSFVLMWLFVIALVIGWSALIYYLMLHVF